MVGSALLRTVPPFVTACVFYSSCSGLGDCGFLAHAVKYKGIFAQPVTMQEKQILAKSNGITRTLPSIHTKVSLLYGLKKILNCVLLFNSL